MRTPSFYPATRVYYFGFAVAALFVVSYFFPVLFSVAQMLVVGILMGLIVDTVLLYLVRKGLQVERQLPDRFSIGDENPVHLHFDNQYRFPVTLTVIDELPPQFQDRSWKRHLTVAAESSRHLTYRLIPKERGEYHFGVVHAWVKGPLRLAQRRYRFDCEEGVKVYPSFFQMRRYQLLAAANKLTETGSKRIRRLGHSLEFEQIKEYVRGEDYRTINWKATARKGDLMVNHFTDERSQQLYCMINKSRIMQLPFDGLTLLDYAINAALVLSNVALLRQDKVGLVTYAEKPDSFLPADRKAPQLNLILETLYKQTTAFKEADTEALFSLVRSRITQRSLLVLFTNYESLEALQRDLPLLKRLAHYHLLLVVLFENTELKSLLHQKAATTEDIYIKTIAEKYLLEKRLMIRELQQHGILAVLSTPQELTVTAINKYLEVKRRQSL